MKFNILCMYLVTLGSPNLWMRRIYNLLQGTEAKPKIHPYRPEEETQNQSFQKSQLSKIHLKKSKFHLFQPKKEIQNPSFLLFHNWSQSNPTVTRYIHTKTTIKAHPFLSNKNVVLRNQLHNHYFLAIIVSIIQVVKLKLHCHILNKLNITWNQLLNPGAKFLVL